MNIYCIKNSIFNSATYLISLNPSNNAFVIDCGDMQPISDFIEQNHLNLKGIFLTHSHFDHIYGLNDLAQDYPNCKVYTSYYGIDGLRDPKLNLSRYHDDVEDFIYQYDNIEVLSEKQDVTIDNNVIKILETPGHDWSCLTFHIGKHLFTGDSYIPNARPQYHFPKGNKKQYYQSEERIKKYAIEHELTIMPGHII